MKVLTVVGARPQFIKAATVSRAIAERSDLREVLVHTGQHFDANMSDVFFDELEIPVPDYHLGISGGGHGAMTGRMLEQLEVVIQREGPDWVLVYGDTNSTLAGALVAAKLHIPIAHVEAGLRSFNRAMPEETNRVLTDHAADLLFTPTDAATKNLCHEGIPEERIRQVGDVMFDAALYYGEKAERCSRILEEHDLMRGDYVLATIHRQENTDDPARLTAIFNGLQQVAKERPVVLPLHPRTRSRLSQHDAEYLTQGLTILDPVSYLDMVMLERGASVVATDSGGVQKEAYFHGVPCVTLRDETEWTELVGAGWNVLAGANDADRITQAIYNAQLSRTVPDLYGSGDTARRIVETLVAYA